MDPPATFHDCKTKRRKSINNRELLLSAGEGRMEDFKSCLEEGASLEFVDRDGDTCLHWAARGRNADMARRILQVAPHIISEENKAGETALEIATKHNDLVLTETFGAAIMGKAQKLQQEFETLTQTRPQEGQSRSFVEATVDEDYTAPLSDDDFWSLSDMICSGTLPHPCKEGAIFEFDFTAVTVSIAVDQRKITPFTGGEAASDDATQQERMKHRIRIKRTEGWSKVEELFQLYRVVKWLKGQKRAFSKETLFNVPPEVYDKLDEENHRAARRFFANLLNEKQRTESKIRSCLTALRDLNEKDIFTHQNANIFIFFLETFAMQDTEPVVFAADKDKDDLRKLKKQYFQKFFLGPIEIMGQIEDIRQFILHNDSRNVLTPESFARFNKETKEIFDAHKDASGALPNGVKVNWNGKVNNLFQNIFTFVKNVHDKEVVSEDRRKVLKNFLLFEKERYLLDNTKFLAVVRQFFKSVQKIADEPGSSVPGELELLSFDLMANIFPRLEHDLPRYGPQRFKRFRNVLVHDFQNVSTATGKTQKVKEGVMFAIPELYKYFIAMELHEVVRSVKVEQEIKKTDEDLCKAIEKVDRTFPDNVKVTLPINLGKESFGNIFEDLDLDVRGNSTQSVSQYLRYMAPLFDVKPQINIDDADSEPIRRLEDLPIHKRIEIFQKFRHFDRVKSQESYEMLREKLELKSLLKGCSSSTNNCTHIDMTQTVEMTVEIDEEESCVRLIKSTLENLKGLRLNKELAPFNMNTEDIILLYEVHLQRRREFSFSNIRLTRSYEFGDGHKQLIENLVNSLPVNEITTMRIGGLRKEIMISSVVMNLLKIFDLSYKQYQVKIPTIKLVFVDETVLDYLVSYDVKREREQKENRSFVYKTIRSLLKLEYTAPYIVRLVTIFKENVIEKQDLLNLVITLVKYSYDHHLSILVSVENPRAIASFCSFLLDFDVSDSTVSTVLMKDSTTVECLLNFFEGIQSRAKNASELSNVAKSSAKKLLTTSHAVALDNINKKKFDIAENILNVIGAIEEEIYGSISAESRLNKAKLALLRGRGCPSSEERKMFLRRALESLASLTSEHFAPKMLALSRQAYVHLLLGECERSRDTQRLLFDEFLKYCLPAMRPSASFDQIYLSLKKSRAYQTLLTLGSEYQKYLNITAIYKTLLKYEEKRKRLDTEETLKVVDGYKRVYWALKQEPDRELTGLLPTLELIAQAYYHVTKRYDEEHCHYEALAFSLRNLEIRTILYSKQKEFLGIHDFRVKRTISVIKSTLNYLRKKHSSMELIASKM